MQKTPRKEKKMEVFGYLLCFLCGAFCVLVAQKKPKERQLQTRYENEQLPVPIPVRLQKQYENFFKFDGTTRGQIKIDDE